jgi:hypothetical protein
LLGVGADREEALPVGVLGGGTGSIVVEAGCGDLDGFDDGGGEDARVVHGGGGRDDGNGLDRIAVFEEGWSGGCVEVEREYVFDGEFLRGQDAVESFEREGAFSVEEIGDVGLLEAGLMGEATAGEETTVDAPKEFKPKEFVKVLKVHNGG